jgi:hypothetical protein
MPTDENDHFLPQPVVMCHVPQRIRSMTNLTCGSQLMGGLALASVALALRQCGCRQTADAELRNRKDE